MTETLNFLTLSASWLSTHWVYIMTLLLGSFLGAVLAWVVIKQHELAGLIQQVHNAMYCYSNWQPVIDGKIEALQKQLNKNDEWSIYLNNKINALALENQKKARTAKPKRKK